MKRKPYPTDLTDEQWELLAPMLPPAAKRGRPRVDLREVINAILYILQAGCAWRLLPHDLPAWQTVYGYLRRWQQTGLWQELHDTLREVVRLTEERQVEPSAAIIDSQSVKCAAPTGERGFDGGKKINGRKRHVLVDTLGLLLGVVVTAASVQDRDGAKLLLERVKANLPRLALIWADSAYAGQLIDWVKTQCGWVLEIVKRGEGVIGFQVLPRRWVVERSLGWLSQRRRLSKDYESRTDTSETFIYVAMIHTMLKRLAPPQ